METYKEQKISYVPLSGTRFWDSLGKTDFSSTADISEVENKERVHVHVKMSLSGLSLTFDDSVVRKVQIEKEQEVERSDCAADDHLLTLARRA